MNHKLALLIGLSVLSQIASVGNANEFCDCKIYPFVPDPPCFKVCSVGIASRASSESLQNVLGISGTLANKISGLDDVDAAFSSVAEIWQQQGLYRSNIQLVTGESLGELTGYYRSPTTDQIHFAVTTDANTLLGIPIDGTTVSDNQAIIVPPHTPVYFTIDQPTWYGGNVEIKDIPSWTSNQLTKDELQILRERMERISQGQFNDLISNYDYN